MAKKQAIPGLSVSQTKTFERLMKRDDKLEDKGKDLGDKKQGKLDTLSGFAEAGKNYTPVENVTGLTDKGVRVYNEVAAMEAAGQDLKKGDQKVLDKLNPYVESQRLVDESQVALDEAIANLNNSKGESEERQAELQAEFARQQALYDEARKNNEAQLEAMRRRTEEDQRNASTREASRVRARRRGGGRALLSAARLNPEVGLAGGQSTLGKSTA